MVLFWDNIINHGSKRWRSKRAIGLKRTTRKKAKQVKKYY